MSISNRRDANLDLLRIISMLLIIFLHSIDHSGVLEQADVCGGETYAYVRFTYALCQVCVNCYVMLSGYYLLNSKFRVHKLVALWMEVVFYSFVLRALFMITGQHAFSIVSLLSCFVPVLTGRYWFITIYVGLYLLFPFLNKLVWAMNKKEHTLMNICLFVLFSLSISIYPSFMGMNSGGGWGIAWFVVLYLLSSWFRLYYTPKNKPAVLVAVFVCIPLIMSASQIGARAAGIDIFQCIISNWYRYDSVPVYLMTLTLFAAFLNIRIENSYMKKIICSVAPLTLGVYLIHAHADVSPWLWETLNLPQYMEYAWFPLLQLMCVVAIFVVCIAIDALRRKILGKLENNHAVWTFCDRISTKSAMLLKNMIDIREAER